ncbi:outer membrane autotransporter domain protein [Pseudooceanicola batsensis HTCC2597]|uniref:Outer membrane autotransporter domain protein n=1 Tax=Pseudooceanicola batsensis (strain ATCC BAA-863 / DSM 15984 / KCTC 12145 / HTCC2597) TaxID=252305 RepID=A3TYY1_PSEBH|nr:SGNH/GDSL hydrolase family protein [Pseudooceanicola batsensis]EAQ02799.1 outer membrane autotransporter domain protein [Pseudooceanicola batsensis HTCC2597]
MRNLLIAAGLTVCISVPAAAGTLGTIFTSYYAFGDSLTDDGKFGLLPPPSAGGRFTNGPTYAEMIAEDFATSDNYALGGATAGPENDNAPYGTATTDPTFDLNQFATLSDQVDVFESDLDLSAAGSRPLVSVLMGSNDIFQQTYLDAGRTVLNPAYDVEDTVDHVIAAVERIAGLGPFGDFIIPLTPGAGDGTFGATRVEYNEYLFEQVAGLRASGLNIYVPNLDAASARIAADPTAYGITETGPCASTGIGSFDPTNCTFAGFDGSGDPIFDLDLANAYSLADPVHPTTPVHREWANEVEATVLRAVAPVPLPASGLLLVAGLGALAVRKRAAA